MLWLLCCISVPSLSAACVFMVTTIYLVAVGIITYVPYLTYSWKTCVVEWRETTGFTCGEVKVNGTRCSNALWRLCWHADMCVSFFLFLFLHSCVNAQLCPDLCFDPLLLNELSRCSH